MTYNECLSILTWNELINKLTLSIFHQDESLILIHKILVKHHFDTSLKEFGKDFVCKNFFIPDYLTDYCNSDLFLSKS